MMQNSTGGAAHEGPPPGNGKKLFWINFFINLFWPSAVITFFYFQRGLGYTEILFLSALMSIAIIIFEVPTGMVADRYGRKKALLLSHLLLLLSVVLHLYARDFFTFALAFIMMGGGIAFSSGATESLLYDSLPRDQKGRARKAFGKFYSAEVLAGMVSPPLASILARNLLPEQFAFLFLLTIGSYASGLFLTLLLREKRDGICAGRGSLKHLIAAMKNRKIRRLVLNRALFSSALVSYMYLWQPQLHGAGIPIVALGAALAAGSLGIFLINRHISGLTDRISTRQAIFVSSLVPAACFAAIAFVVNPFAAVAGYLIIRTIGSIREPLLSELINQEIPAASRASLLSLFSLVSSVLALVLRPVIGVLSDISLSWGLLGLGMLCAAALIIFPITELHARKEKAGVGLNHAVEVE